MRITFQQPNNTNFKAIPLAKYCYLNDKAKNVIVYQLEQKDADYLKYVSRHIKGFCKKYEIEGESTKQVAKEAFDAGDRMEQIYKWLINK